MVSLDQLVRDLKVWEGVYAHLYLDDRGYPTTGIGNLVATPAEMLPLPWQVMGPSPATWRAATAAEKTDTWRTVNGMPKGLRATAYAVSTRLRLMIEDIEKLCRSRLEHEFLPRLQHLFTGWAQYPDDAQRAIVDMAYNLGVGGLSRYTRMRAACATWNWEQAAVESLRPGRRDARNKWTSEMLRKAKDAKRTPPAAP